MFAMLFAKKIMETLRHARSTIENQLAGKQWLVEQLDRNCYEYRSSEGNFMFIKPFSDASEFVRRMQRPRKAFSLKSMTVLALLAAV